MIFQNHCSPSGLNTFTASLKKIRILSRIKSSSLLLVLGVIFLACSEGRQDPLGPVQGNGLTEGRLTMTGSYGPNVVVTRSNADSASQIIIEAVLTAFQKAVNAAVNRPSLTEWVRMTGGYQGYAVVDGSTELVETDLNCNLKVIFYDYSNDGLFYFGGSLQYLGSIDQQGVTGNIRINDEIKFAGPYTGFIRFNNFLLAVDEQGNPVSVFAPPEVTNRIIRSGSVTFNSGGNKFIYDPYPPPRPENL